MANLTGVPVWREIGATPLPRRPEARLETVVVGAGPVGLTLALDLARRGRQVTVLTRLDFVAAGSKLGFWLTTPMARRTRAGSASTSMPATCARPLSGRLSVVRILIVVDLPAPFGPSSAKTVPADALNERPSSARVCVLSRPVISPSSSHMPMWAPR